MRSGTKLVLGIMQAAKTQKKQFSNRKV